MSEQKLITSRKLQQTKVKEKKLHPAKIQNLKFHMISFQKTQQRGYTTSHVHQMSGFVIKIRVTRVELYVHMRFEVSHKKKLHVDDGLDGITEECL